MPPDCSLSDKPAHLVSLQRQTRNPLYRIFEPVVLTIFSPLDHYFLLQSFYANSHYWQWY